MISKNQSFLIINDILSNSLMLRTRVTGKSMSPFLKNGETVTLLKANNYSAGDVVLFKNHKNHLMLHRIIHSRWNHPTKRNLQTKGDAIGHFDDPISDDMILGKVIKIEKKIPLFGSTHIRTTSYFWLVISRLIVIKTLIGNHKIYAMIRPYLTPQIVTLYRTLRARLTA